MVFSSFYLNFISLKLKAIKVFIGMEILATFLKYEHNLKNPFLLDAILERNIEFSNFHQKHQQPYINRITIIQHICWIGTLTEFLFWTNICICFCWLVFISLSIYSKKKFVFFIFFSRLIYFSIRSKDGPY